MKFCFSSRKSSQVSQVSKPEDKHYVVVYATSSTMFEWLQKERERVEEQ